MSARLLSLLLSAAPLDFEWQAPAGCPTADVLQARLAGLSGMARAAVTEGPTGWRLEVQVNDSVRELVTRSCDEAADATVLIVELALTAPVTEPAPPPPDVPAEVLSREAPRPSEAARLHLSLAAGALVGWLPQVVGRLGALASIEWRSAVLLAQVFTGLPQRYVGGPTASAAVALQLLIDVQVGGCWAFTLGRLRAGPCALGGAGALSVQGQGVESPKTTLVVVPHGGAGLRATLALTESLELAAAVWGRGSARPSVSFQGFAPVVQASWASADFVLGAGGVF
ncbi:MAG: hypothetical protein IAE78_28995 [Myxococcus sp.]|nr:hypothetical protein [Myxococcus sp.]